MPTSKTIKNKISQSSADKTYNELVENFDEKKILDMNAILSAFTSPVELHRYFTYQRKILYRLKEQSLIQSCNRFWLSHDELQTIYSFLWFDKLNVGFVPYDGDIVVRNTMNAVFQYSSYDMCRCVRCRNIVFKTDALDNYCLDDCYKTSSGIYCNYSHHSQYLCKNCVHKIHNRVEGFKPVCPVCKSVEKFHLIDYDNITNSYPAREYIDKIILNGDKLPFNTATTIKINVIEKETTHHPIHDIGGCNWIYMRYIKGQGYNLINTNSYLFKIAVMYQRVRPDHRDDWTNGIYEINNDDLTAIFTSSYRDTISKSILKARLMRFKTDMTEYLDFKNASFHRSILDNHRLEHAYTGNIVINADKVIEADVRCGKIVDGMINKSWFMYAMTEQYGDDENYDINGERLKYDKERILNWSGLPTDMTAIIMSYDDDEPIEDDDLAIEEELIEALDDIHEYINADDYESIGNRINDTIRYIADLYAYETTDLPTDKEKSPTHYLPRRL